MLECKCIVTTCMSFFFNDTATTEIYTLSLHDALPVSNRPIAAPVVADIGSAMSAFLGMLKPGQIKVHSACSKAIADHKQHNIEGMAARLNANPKPKNFSSVLRALTNTLAIHKRVPD